ncbi:MAG: nicotinate (nicotinamide) nucleotide adenylyltransferase [Candidatus Levybacteria bacterium]|nr:nicotinate (nicotinamide) nucleotide adenylyltransferase [Candidatus Levybacteria bacterium]
MRIGILGGSFDPPHFGHILVARQVKETLNLDEVWLMPYFMHSWDQNVSSAYHRFEMTKLIEEKGIITCDEEVRYKRKSYTIETVKRLKKKYPYDFFWIVGSDVLTSFKRWKEHEALIREIKFLIVARDGHYLPSKLPKGFKLVSSPEFIASNISSSIIRRRIKKRLSVDGLVSKPVLSYIQKHNLYKKA